MNETLQGTPYREQKDRVFRMLFNDNSKLLELYNAMNGTDYKNPEELTITTLDNAIYMGMKNDVSFLLHNQLCLYEHQSTYCPNMPMRDLQYVSRIYSQLLGNKNLYSSKLVKIPEPKFVVFYNGKLNLPEKMELRLSDAFEKKTDDIALELKVQVLNINLGYNKKLMENCITLREYMRYVDKIRRHNASMPIRYAVEKAIDECIKEGILKDFLQKNRSEVLSMSIFEYDEEKHMEQVHQEGYEDGKIEGFEEGRAEGRAEGERHSKNWIAKKMLEKGVYSDEDIISLTEITKEELYELKKNMVG